MSWHFSSGKNKGKIVVFKNAKTLRAKRLAIALSKLVNKHGPIVQASLTKGIRSFKGKADFQALVKATEKGTLTDKQVDKLFPWDDLSENLQEVDGKLKTATVAASTSSEQIMPTIIKPLFRFDTTNPRINKFISKRTGTMVKEVTNETRKAVKSMVKASFDGGLPPRKGAKLIQDSIGLTERQGKSLVNFQIDLEKKGIKGDKLLKRVSSRRDKMIRDRTRMIARTETQNAINQGQQEIWNQASEQGLVDAEKTKKRWITFIQPSSAEGCILMDGTEVGLNDLWPYPDGRLLEVPSDAHPNCNCLFEVIPIVTAEREAA